MTRAKVQQINALFARYRIEDEIATKSKLVDQIGKVMRKVPIYDLLQYPPYASVLGVIRHPGRN